MVVARCAIAGALNSPLQGRDAPQSSMPVRPDTPGAPLPQSPTRLQTTRSSPPGSCGSPCQQRAPASCRAPHQTRVKTHSRRPIGSQTGPRRAAAARRKGQPPGGGACSRCCCQTVWHRLPQQCCVQRQLPQGNEAPAALEPPGHQTWPAQQQSMQHQTGQQASACKTCRVYTRRDAGGRLACVTALCGCRSRCPARPRHLCFPAHFTSMLVAATHQACQFVLCTEAL